MEGANHLSAVLFTKENMDTDKPVPVVNLTNVKFIGAPPQNREEKETSRESGIHIYW